MMVLMMMMMMVMVMVMTMTMMHTWKKHPKTPFFKYSQEALLTICKPAYAKSPQPPTRRPDIFKKPWAVLCPLYQPSKAQPLFKDEKEHHQAQCPSESWY